MNRSVQQSMVFGWSLAKAISQPDISLIFLYLNNCFVYKSVDLMLKSLIFILWHSITFTELRIIGYSKNG